MFLYQTYMLMWILKTERGEIYEYIQVRNHGIEHIYNVCVKERGKVIKSRYHILMYEQLIKVKHVQDIASVWIY